MVEVSNDEQQDYGLIDSIHYKGGPISQKEHSEFRRQHFTDGHKLAMRKKKEGNDDSESDNSDKSGTRPRPKRKATAKAMVRALDDSKKQTLSEDACNELDKADDSDCVYVPPKKRTRMLSKTSDGVSWKGIKLPSIEKLLDGTFGESSNGRIRVTLSYPRSLLRMQALLLDLFKCSSEVDVLALLKTSCGKHFRFQFYYKSEGYLYSCINPDGLCGPRNFAALQKGI